MDTNTEQTMFNDSNGKTIINGIREIKTASTFTNMSANSSCEFELLSDSITDWEKSYLIFHTAIQTDSLDINGFLPIDSSVTTSPLFRSMLSQAELSTYTSSFNYDDLTNITKARVNNIPIRVILPKFCSDFIKQVDLVQKNGKTSYFNKIGDVACDPSNFDNKMWNTLFMDPKKPEFSSSVLYDNFYRCNSNVIANIIRQFIHGSFADDTITGSPTVIEIDNAIDLPTLHPWFDQKAYALLNGPAKLKLWFEKMSEILYEYEFELSANVDISSTGIISFSTTDPRFVVGNMARIVNNSPDFTKYAANKIYVNFNKTYLLEYCPYNIQTEASEIPSIMWSIVEEIGSIKSKTVVFNDDTLKELPITELVLIFNKDSGTPIEQSAAYNEGFTNLEIAIDGVPYYYSNLEGVCTQTFGQSDLFTKLINDNINLAKKDYDDSLNASSLIYQNNNFFKYDVFNQGMPVDFSCSTDCFYIRATLNEPVFVNDKITVNFGRTTTNATHLKLFVLV